MGKTSGRGRGWRKKGWSQLAPSTQARYRRMGIDATAHNAGVTPARVQRFIEKQEQLYGWVDEGGGAYSISVNGTEYMAYLPRGRELAELINEQESAENEFQSGDEASAKARWESRPKGGPEWMYFYHGHFH